MNELWPAQSIGFEGPFAGVPFLVKGSSCSGISVQFWLTAFRQLLPDQGSPFTHRLDQAGLNILGVTTSRSLAYLVALRQSFMDQLRIHWTIELSAGGSSGGAAAGSSIWNCTYGPCQ